jgi:hypothetical protein
MVWQNWAAIATVAAVALVLLGHIVTYAYKQGQTDKRLETVEENVRTGNGIGGAVSALTATVAALEKSVERLDRAVESMSRRSSRGRGSDEP